MSRDRETIERIAQKLGPAVQMLMQGQTTESCIKEMVVLCGGFPSSIDDLKGRLQSSIAVLLVPNIETALSPQDERDLWAVLQKWRPSNQQKR